MTADASLPPLEWQITLNCRGQHIKTLSQPREGIMVVQIGDVLHCYDCQQDAVVVIASLYEGDQLVLIGKVSDE